jgi:hypothetical protein
MKKIATVLVFTGLLTSCQYFQAERISKETYLEEEVESINWREVDRYPLLESCSELSDKTQQQRCFTQRVSQVVQAMVDHNLSTTAQSVSDTIYLEFFVSEKAKLLITDLRIGRNIQAALPELEALLLTCTDSLKLVAPAYKRGIPVKTQFTLPVVLRSKEL